jgi:hypothetical protein
MSTARFALKELPRFAGFGDIFQCFAGRNYRRLILRERCRGNHCLPLQDLGCKVLELVFIPRSAASFYNYAVGPWVSVAGREAALARGNPVKGIQ